MSYEGTGMATATHNRDTPRTNFGFLVTSQGLFDLKPGGDAISRLLMTVLAAIAEFEHHPQP